MPLCAKNDGAIAYNPNVFQCRNDKGGVALPDRGVQVQMTMSCAVEGKPETVISPDVDEEKAIFGSNYMYWNRETAGLSSNNYDNHYFQAIVKMGEKAVPMIYNIIKQNPHPIVYALDLIYPNVLSYSGNVSLKEVCKAWTTTLKLLGKI